MLLFGMIVYVVVCVAMLSSCIKLSCCFDCHSYFIAGQSCVDVVDVEQRGTDLFSTGTIIGAQVIVPMTAFSCNGIITGYLISLQFDSRQRGNPTIQVFRPTSSSSYSEVHEYTLQDSDITDMGDYHLANVSFTGSKVQSGDIIGYYIRNTPRYNIWNIQAIGYTSYAANRFNPSSSFTISNNGTASRQPLIQVIFGKFVLPVS